MSAVVDDLIAADDSEMLVMSMLRGDDLRNALEDDAGRVAPAPDVLAGPFAHVVVDEAQELTDAEWQMLLLRCPPGASPSWGIARRPGAASRSRGRRGWSGSGSTGSPGASLTVNYRTPVEVMAEAEPAIRAVLPDANVPTSIRSSGIPVLHGDVEDLSSVVEDWLATHEEGVACVIGDASFRGTRRVRSLTAERAKGLEFDLVVLVDPDRLGSGVEGAVDRYVAMTRATERLVVLTSDAGSRRALRGETDG